MGQSHVEDNKITEEQKEIKLERSFLYKDCRETEFSDIDSLPWVRTKFVLHKCKIKTYRNEIMDKKISVDSYFKIISDDFRERTLTFVFRFGNLGYKGVIQSESVQDMLNLKNLITRSKRPAWEKSRRCQLCSADFSLIRRKHHCRNCGKILCADCSPYEILLKHLGYNSKQRVCRDCYESNRAGGFRTAREHSRSFEAEPEVLPKDLSQFKFTFAPNDN